MNKTPKSSRFHIGIYGNTNVGKSSFINAIFKREISIVSEESGTTTDPIYKNIEIDGLGPLTFIDTGGLDDKTRLGNTRIKKTYETLNEIDFAIYIGDYNLDLEEYLSFKEKIKKKDIPYILVINKIDLCSEEELANIQDKLSKLEESYISISTENDKSLNRVIDYLKENIEYKKENLFRGIVQRKKHILFVVSIDSEYPENRLILPQSQSIRDALGNDNFISIVKFEELKEFLEIMTRVDLIVTDSKIFKEVKDLVGHIPLTSFSILMANLKGDIQAFIDGIKSLEKLKYKKDIKIFIYESCNHTANHEDIGRVKIPNLLRQYFEEEIKIDFATGKNFEEFKNYDLLIHCGACMENKKLMMNKIDICRENNIPIINYGILLAYFANILEKSIKIF